ncbi:acyl carrier protein phosphodiesterase [soil metagenome]
MNYLAHAYLSFNDPSIVTGNMISDVIKGKQKFDYPPAIQKGIMLHRAIDEFTDAHEVTRQAKMYFKIPYRLYAGAFVDIVYDHFLANDKNQFINEKSLYTFSQATYSILDNNMDILPPKFLYMLPYMKEQNWLYGYRLKEGIEKSFIGMVQRAAYLSDATEAYNLFIKYYDELSQCYNEFFPELKDFTLYQLSQNGNK